MSASETMRKLYPDFIIYDIVQAIEEAGTRTALTGSRFLRTHNEFSDWDFFLDGGRLAAENMLGDLYTVLMAGGFKQREPGIYVTGEGKDNTFSVWENNNIACHMIVVKDFDLAVRVQNVIEASGLGEACRDKSEQRRIWNKLYKVLRQ